MLNFLALSVFVFPALGGIQILLKYVFNNFVLITQDSFIVLVERDKEHRGERKAKRRTQLLIAVSGWLMSVVSSVVASFAYSWFIE